MSEYLIKASTENPWAVQGVVCAEREDGAFWGKKETLPAFVLIKVPEIPLGERRFLIQDKLYSDYEVRVPGLEPGKIEVKEASGWPLIDKAQARLKVFELASNAGVTGLTAISDDTIKFDKADMAVKDIEIELRDKLREQLVMRYLFDTTIIVDMVKTQTASKVMTAVEFTAAITDIMVV